MEAAQELAFYIESNQERFYRIAYTYVKTGMMPWISCITPS